jgi:CBS domain-containing protein
MWMHGIRRLPVLKDGRPVGIISTSEIAEHALACNLCMERIFEEFERREKIDGHYPLTDEIIGRLRKAGLRP